MMNLKNWCVLLSALLLAVACQQKQHPTPHPQAFALADVQLKPSPFLTAFEQNQKWLLDLSPDRFLHRFHTNAGLPPKDSIYGGWESLGVSGQTMGHYLSALAMTFAVIKDEKFRSRINYIVDELARCQEAHGNGFVGAFPEFDRIFTEIKNGDVRTAGFDLNGGWVPWYNLHKTFAGLLDVYQFTGNEKALAVAKKLGIWADEVTAGLTEEAFQRMLVCEHGGMNESLAQLYAITGEKRFYDLSLKFNHKNVLDPILAQQDHLNGLHANTQIPKVIGLARQFELDQDEQKQEAVAFFWDRVVHHHSYVIGGNSDFEHFGAPDSLGGRLSANSAETCNTYNMLKLTEHLSHWQPKVAYADYYERALYNHILASQNPQTGMVCYYVNMQSGLQKVYSTRFDSFWCCVGSGLENHSKYGAFIYQHEADQLWVNLYIPSVLTWNDHQIQIEQITQYPENGQINLKVKGNAAQSLTFNLRIPEWSNQPVNIYVNDELETVGVAGEYAALKRKWKDGDRIRFELPLNVRTESLAGESTQKAFLYGPLVLAADLGAEPVSLLDIPVLLDNGDGVDQLISQTGKLQFELSQSDFGTLHIKPFYQIIDEAYAIYLDVLEESDWKRHLAEINKQKQAMAAMERATLDRVRVGEMQPERDHHFNGEQTEAGGRVDKWRHAVNGGWFSYELQLQKTQQDVKLQCQYFGNDGGNRNFDILVDGRLVATEQLIGDQGAKHFYVDYPIPDVLLKGKEKITVRFQAHAGATAGGVFDVRLMKM